MKPRVSEHPKCEDLVVAFKVQTTEGLFRIGVRTHLRFLKELLHTIFKLRYVKFHVVLKSFPDIPNCVL